MQLAAISLFISLASAGPVRLSPRQGEMKIQSCGSQTYVASEVLYYAGSSSEILLGLT